MTHTVDSLMALADEYTENKAEEDCAGDPSETMKSRCALFEALTEALAQPNHSEQLLDMVAVQAAQPVLEQSSENYMRGFNDGMKEAPTGECWIRVIDEAMVGAHIGVVNMGDDYGTAKEKLNSLICWSVEVDRELNKPAQPVREPEPQEQIQALLDDFMDSLDELLTAQVLHDFSPIFGGAK